MIVTQSLLIAGALQLAAILTTFVCVWLTATKSPAAPWWGQAANAAWFALYAWHGLYGLLIVPVVMALLYARVSLKWRRA